MIHSFPHKCRYTTVLPLLLKHHGRPYAIPKNIIVIIYNKEAALAQLVDWSCLADEMAGRDLQLHDDYWMRLKFPRLGQLDLG